MLLDFLSSSMAFCSILPHPENRYGSDYISHCGQWFSVLEGSLLFLMACCHLSKEEFGAMWFMVNTLGALLCTASKVSLHLLSTFPCKMERHISKELWKEINGGLFIMHKDALFDFEG